MDGAFCATIKTFTPKDEDGKPKKFHEIEEFSPLDDQIVKAILDEEKRKKGASSSLGGADLQPAVQNPKATRHARAAAAS